MPSDIRSFFGGGPKLTAGTQSTQKADEPLKKKSAPKKSGRASRVIDDSDDDEETEAKPTFV